MGGIHTASNCLQPSDADGACLPPVWLKSRRLPRLRVLNRGSSAIGAALALPDITSYHILQVLGLASFHMYSRIWNPNVILNHADGKP